MNVLHGGFVSKLGKLQNGLLVSLPKSTEPQEETSHPHRVQLARVTHRLLDPGVPECDQTPNFGGPNKRDEFVFHEPLKERPTLISACAEKRNHFGKIKEIGKINLGTLKNEKTLRPKTKRSGAKARRKHTSNQCESVRPKRAKLSEQVWTC